MARYLDGVGTKFRGYNKGQVEKYIKELEIRHLHEINTKKRKLENSFQQVGKLKDEYEELLFEKEKLEKKAKIMELAFKRVNEASVILNKLAEAEAEAILRETKRKITVHDKQIQTIQNEIKNRKVNIDSLMGNFAQLLQEQESGGKVVGKIYPAASKVRNILDRTAALDKANKALNEEDVKEKAHWVEETQKITADGTNIVYKQYFEKANEIIEQFEPEAAAAKIDSPSSFWDETEETQIVENPEQEASQKEAAVAAEQQKEPILEGENNSKALAEEIKSTRYKYIVGKIAGENMTELDGTVIVHKNQVITPEIVDKAEKAGKLAELIVHMIIPGLED